MGQPYMVYGRYRIPCRRYSWPNIQVLQYYKTVMKIANKTKQNNERFKVNEASFFVCLFCFRVASGLVWIVPDSVSKAGSVKFDGAVYMARKEGAGDVLSPLALVCVTCNWQARLMEQLPQDGSLIYPKSCFLFCPPSESKRTKKARRKARKGRKKEEGGLCPSVGSKVDPAVARIGETVKLDCIEQHCIEVLLLSVVASFQFGSKVDPAIVRIEEQVKLDCVEQRWWLSFHRNFFVRLVFCYSNCYNRHTSSNRRLSRQLSVIFSQVNTTFI